MPGSLFCRLTGASLGMLLLVMSGVVLGPRVFQADYRCLRYYDSTGYHLIDTGSGQVAPDRRIRLSPSAASGGPAYSPDRTMWAGVGGNMPGYYSLSIENLVTGEGVGLQGNIANWFDSDVGTAWSPDGRRLAYLWIDNNGQHFLATVRSDGRDKREVTLVDPHDPAHTFTTGLQGWSPDGQYLAVGVGRTIQFFSSSDLRLVSTAPGRPAASIYGRRGVSQTAWASQGHVLAFAWTDRQQRDHLTITDPDGTISQTMATYLSESEGGTQFFWLPGDQSVMIKTLLNSQWYIDVLGVQGVVAHDLARVNPHLSLGDRGAWEPVLSRDGRLLVFYEVQNSYREALKVFQLSSGLYETLADPLLAFMPAPQGERLAVAWGEWGKQITVDVMDLDGKQRRTIVADAREVQNMLWSPDGQSLVVLWKAQSGDADSVRLTLADSVGKSLTEFRALSPILYDLLWSGDGQAFAYISGNETRVSLDVVNSDTREPRRLLQDRLAISVLRRDGQTGWLTVLWQNRDGAIEAGFYHPGDAGLFSAVVQDPVRDQVAWLPPAMSTTSPWDAQAHVFPAPSGQAVVVRLGHRETVMAPHDDFSLQIAGASRQPARLLRSGLASISDPLWSPDGKNVVVIEHTPQGFYPSLELWSVDGRLIAHLDRYLGGDDTLAWTRCD